MAREPVQKHYTTLQAWIALANRVTPDVEQEIESRLASLRARELPPAAQKREYEAARAGLFDAVRELDALYAPFAGPLRAITGREVPGYQAFEAARAARETLRQLAEFDQTAVDRGLSVMLTPVLPPAVRVAADFTIEPVCDLTDAFLAALAGRDVRRIGRCPVCDRLLVRLNANQVACSKRCANAERVRRFRNPEKRREYAQNSQINRLVKRGIALAQAIKRVKRDV